MKLFKKLHITYITNNRKNFTMIAIDRQPLTFELQQKLLHYFKDVDFSVIESVLYLGGWQTAIQGTGLLIFEDFNKIIHYSTWQYTPLEIDIEHTFEFFPISIDEAFEYINKMNSMLLEIEELKKTNIL